MSHTCRARAETPLEAIALGTTPLHGFWPAQQATPVAGTRLRLHEPLPAKPFLLIGAPLLVLLIHTYLSPPTAVAALAPSRFRLGAHRALARHAVAAGAGAGGVGAWHAGRAEAGRALQVS